MTNHICPHCNCLLELQLNCPACGGNMIDCGPLQNALGPYAPYEENSIINGEYGCVHLMQCPDCQLQLQMTIPT